MIDQDDALRIGIPFDAWFWMHADTSAGVDGCWPWRGLDFRKYITFNGRAEIASRIAYILTKGPIPDGLFICHACDNPPCCNPTHLWAGTHQDNMDDMIAKGRDHGRPPVIGQAALMAINAELDRGVPLEEVARRIDVSTSAIYRAFERNPHILRSAARPVFKSGRPSSISPVMLIEIRRMIDEGTPITEISRRLGVSRPAIYRAIRD